MPRLPISTMAISMCMSVKQAKMYLPCKLSRYEDKSTSYSREETRFRCDVMNAKMLLVCGTRVKLDVLVLAIVIWNEIWCAWLSHHEHRKWFASWDVSSNEHGIWNLATITPSAEWDWLCLCFSRHIDRMHSMHYCFLRCSILNCMWHMEIRLWSCLSVQRIYDHSTLHDMSLLLLPIES